MKHERDDIYTKTGTVTQRYVPKSYETEFLRSILSSNSACLIYGAESEARQGRLRLRVVATSAGLKGAVSFSQEGTVVYGWVPDAYGAKSITPHIKEQAKRVESRVPREGLDPRLAKFQLMMAKE